MKLEFDETNLLADMVGDADGISRTEVKAARAIAADGLAAFRKRSESGEVGFPHLPFQTALIDSIRKYAGNLTGSLLADPNEHPGVEQLFDPSADPSVTALICHTAFPFIDLIPANAVRSIR